MTKVADDSTSSTRCVANEETQKLEEYKSAIENSGFLLEARVCGVIRILDYVLTPNSPIPHPEQPNELIEVDVEASAFDFVPKGGWSSTNVILLIECKLNTQPIAFFSHPQPSPENSYLAAHCTDPGTAKLGFDLLEDMSVEKWHHYAGATVATQFC